MLLWPLTPHFSLDVTAPKHNVPNLVGRLLGRHGCGKGCVFCKVCAWYASFHRCSDAPEASWGFLPPYNINLSTDEERCKCTAVYRNWRDCGCKCAPAVCVGLCLRPSIIRWFPSFASLICLCSDLWIVVHQHPGLIKAKLWITGSITSRLLMPTSAFNEKKKLIKEIPKTLWF